MTSRMRPSVSGQPDIIRLSNHAGDYAALRRYLVDEGFLGRERNIYWRTGGTVDV